MYDFHHNFIKKDFDAKLIFTDTDSLTYETKYAYEEFFKNKSSVKQILLVHFFCLYTFRF